MTDEVFFQSIFTHHLQVHTVHKDSLFENLSYGQRSREIVKGMVYTIA